MKRADWLFADPRRLMLVVTAFVALPVILAGELDTSSAMARATRVVLAAVVVVGSGLFGVIAGRDVRQRRALRESLEQHAATVDVLNLIIRSSFEIQPVFQAIVDRAAGLFDPPPTAIVVRRDGADVVIMAMFPPASEGPVMHVGARMAAGRTTGFGRALLDGVVAHIPDPSADPDANQMMDGTRLGVPIVHNGEVIGAIGLARRGVHPFSHSEIHLVETFASQAAIALENARLVNEIRDQRRQLELASQHKSEFLANMSHELRTPLNAIIGFSEVLLQRLAGELNGKQEEYVTDILESGKHQLSLINDILDLSKVEAGRMELELSEFALADVLTSVLTLMREQAARRRTRLDLSIEPDVKVVAADQRKLKQVVLNLVANAVKFTPDGGRVSVSARRSADVIEVSVRDDGMGIAVDDQARIFEEFARIGATTHEGTGLGLTLAKRFIELHGGRIWVESAPGQGSTFTFTLPTRAPPPFDLRPDQRGAEAAPG